MDEAPTAQRGRTGGRDGAHGQDEPPHRQLQDRPPQGEVPAGQAGDRPAPASPWRRRLLIGGGILAALLIAAGGGWWWRQSRLWEATDDAFLEAHVTRVAPQVAGRVAQLLVSDNQPVEAGQFLVRIDPRDYEVQLATARARQGSAAAQLAEARAQVAVRRAAIGQAQANVAVADADRENAETSLRRFQKVDPRAVTQQARDDAEAQSRSARARLEAARQEVAAAEAQASAGEAALKEAEAAVANAELQLSYTRILAPVAGRVANRGVEIGNYVTPGQALLSVVAPEVWVTANFKETQLHEIRPGQAVRIRVDAYPDPVLNGRVDSIQRGTGARFSVLPPQNATGNYVKITSACR